MPNLKAEKFNKRPASNKRPPPAHPAHLSDNQIEIELSSNKRLPQRCSFLQSTIYINLALFHLHVLLLPFIVLLQDKHTTLAENGENLISAHSKGPKI